MSEINLMCPQPVSLDKRREKNLHRFGHGVSPGRRAKDDKPTAPSTKMRSGLPMMLAVLLAVAGGLSGCTEKDRVPNEGVPWGVATFTDHGARCWTYGTRNDAISCLPLSTTDGGVR